MRFQVLFYISCMSLPRPKGYADHAHNLCGRLKLCSSKGDSPVRCRKDA
jgi:hypothetical protein